MIAPFPDLLRTARDARSAVGAFTVYSLDGAVGVLSAAEEREVDVIVLVSAQTFRSPVGRPLVAALRELCGASTVRCSLQLDHTGELELIRAGLECGFGAVMADGSSGSFEENVELVRSAVALAREHGAWIEAELGRVEGDEEVSSGAAVGALTDPGEAERFLEATGADCLAVSIGNVHGHYRSEPRLDLPRLEAIAARVPQPLSLHGASGLPATAVVQAIARGVCKVNVNTELRETTFAALAEGVESLRDGARLLALGELVSRRVGETTAAKLDDLRPDGLLTTG